MIGIAAWAAAVGLAGCSADPLGPERAAYAANRARWAALEIDTYRYEFALQCFCGGPGSRPVAIAVEAGVVSAVNNLDDGSPVDPATLAEYPTVEDLFDWVAEWLEREPYRVVRNIYDADYGYPTDVFIDFEENTADEELGFTASQLTVVRIMRG